MRRRTRQIRVGIGRVGGGCREQGVRTREEREGARVGHAVKVERVRAQVNRNGDIIDAVEKLEDPRAARNEVDGLKWEIVGRVPKAIRPGDRRASARRSAAVVVSHRDTDRIRVCRRAIAWRCAVVKVRVAGTEARDARAERECGHRGPITPVDHNGVRVLHTGIGERAAQRRRVVFVDDARNDAQHEVRGIYVLHRRDDRVRVAARVVVRDGHRDCVIVLRRAGRIVVPVLVGHVEGRGPGGQRIGHRGTLAPIDHQGKGVQRSRVGDVPGQACDAVLVDRGGYGCIAERRRHVVDRQRRAGIVRQARVVGHRDLDCINEVRRTAVGFRTVVEVLVRGREGSVLLIDRGG